MPQINRVRVNNVKYNFGTQFYDDFMMRFNCRNTIYDLANGGGKSLLMLLLMQNMIPNCTLDEKQPIEKLFRKGSGNTCIHSLVEWKLDSHCQRDGYRYMTTGFCARKARSAEEREESEMKEVRNTTALDVLGSSSSYSGAISQDNTSIEYFNYCIFYKQFGANDIKNLPLAHDGERVTYNGLKAYLRDVTKEDKGIEVHIFDRKGDYQSFISKYGIYESAWEIVRGINKTEGHVRTYFETNYRTSRKVVEDLLIEEIIQKSYNNRLSVDNDDTMMAQTLLDIKDKLIELSRKNSQISNYDNQMEVLGHFKEYVGTYNEFYGNKKKTEESLYKMYASAVRMASDKQSELDAHDKKNAETLKELEEKKKNIAVAKVLSEKKSLREIEVLVKNSTDVLTQKKNRIEDVKKRLMLMESANDYCDYIGYEKELLKVDTALDNRMREDEDITSELAELAGEYKVYYEKHIKEFKDMTQTAAQDEKQAYDMLEEAKDNHRNAEKDCAVVLGLRDNLQEKIGENEIKQQKLCGEYGVLVADTAGEELEKCSSHMADINADIDNIQKEIEEDTKQIYKVQEQINLLKTRKNLLEESILRMDEQSQMLRDNADRLSDIERVYGVKLADDLDEAILAAYTKMNTEYNEQSRAYDKLNKYIEALKAGSYYMDSPERNVFKDYLCNMYGEDVVEGHEWVSQLNESEREELLKRIPFAEYGFVVKNDFDRVKNNDALSAFGRGTQIYPVISEKILKDTKTSIDKDMIVFAFKGMDFLRDDAKRNVEIMTASEELDNINVSMQKLSERKQIVWEDYTFVVKYEAIAGNAHIKAVENAKDEFANVEEQLSKIVGGTDAYKEKKQTDTAKLDDFRKQSEKLAKQIEGLKNIVALYEEVSEEQSQLKIYNDKLAKAERTIIECAAHLDKMREEYIKANEYKDNADKRYTELVYNWENNFSKFYSENIDSQDGTLMAENADSSDSTLTVADSDNTVADADVSDKVSVENTAKEYTDEDIRELTGRFTGLKDILMNKNADLTDKEALKSHLELSMKKCIDSIGYRGESIENLKELYAQGKISVSSAEKLHEISDELEKLQNEYSESDRELGMKEAMLNRIEGSVSYAVSQIEERFGVYEEFECDNPDDYVNNNIIIVNSLEKKLKEEAGAGKKLEGELKDIQVCRKDIERIMTNAGIEVPDEETLKKTDIKYSDYSKLNKEYEQTAKEYSSILKLEYKKVDEFARYKAKLIDELKKYNADDLATQISMSVNMPKDEQQTHTLIVSIDETNSYIELEKTRVHKGIEDMEKIKDNFENRCIQTCSNIRTELERLPKLSHIKMDNEDISIISLVIPYVKESEYKEKMSGYIDETIEAAESFKNQDERFRYIRNRLTWKRLFSVIVTDMNSIRINLYKRERIKDQSRYLRYEEAVGSTGQSQGIYIQFLIAIINYISNINTVSDGGITGNTIFIDNPFGAAKDIYIWEPIFKLLAVNHIQLIVPARGATPAITSRFDVNYILGQKMADNRQQTVVVDYYSNVKEQELEYTRMNYEQASFDFI